MSAEQPFEDTTIATLAKAIEGTSRQQEVIASNIANAETPGYQPRRVSFEESLRQALQQPADRRLQAIANVRPVVVERGTGSLRRDASGVDLEAELVALSAASLRHRALTRLLNKKLTMLREAIEGGGR